MGETDLIDLLGVRMLPAPAESNARDHALAGIIIDHLRDLLLHHHEFIAQRRVAAIQIQDILADSLGFCMSCIELADNIRPVPKHPMRIEFLAKSLALALHPAREDFLHLLQLWIALRHLITS